MSKEEKTKKLFDAFPSVSTEEWEEKIYKDLKGLDYDRKLMWKTLENFKVKPYYREEDLENLGHLDFLPNEFPFVRGNKTENNSWKIQQNISLKNIEEANKKALYVLMKGVTSLAFKIENPENFSYEDFENLLKDIKITCVEINFLIKKDAKKILNFLSNYLKKNNIDEKEIKGSIFFDPIGHLTLNGKSCCETTEIAFENAKKLILISKKSIPNLRVLTISGDIFKNAGGNIVQEIAFSLAIGNEYLAKLTEFDISVDEISKVMQFNFAVGTNYFMEIAKIRATRMLWAKIVKEYKPVCDSSAKMFIHSVTSSYNKTIYDPYTNVLRETTEAMSAAIAGVDSLNVLPFDDVYKNSNEFSERIARNIQILLQEEANLDKNIDASAGSYYIENLTYLLAKESWKLFQKIEENGGYLKSYENNFIYDEIKNTAKKQDKNISFRKTNLLGTNQFPNFDEEIKENIEKDLKFSDKKSYSKSINTYRLSSEFEKLRLKTERLKKAPKVFNFTYGNLNMRKARSAFSCNFFACAGFEVIDNFGFKTIDEGIKESLKNKSDIVVICSSDEEYSKIVPEIYEKLNENSIIVVAGFPKNCIVDLKKIGIKHFIHIKSNVLEELQKFQKELKI
ncbi:MAG: hypothetical protein B6I24_05855 [Bacteroidetes bacterium 4572_128]|nr:MAG: hypothetical protein B6I24_05855 [Bacteroidetes bacterium 4572_128]